MATKIPVGATVGQRVATRPKLLVVDDKNVPKLDLSVLPESYRAFVFVGSGQNPPRASRHADVVFSVNFR